MSVEEKMRAVAYALAYMRDHNIVRIEYDADGGNGAHLHRDDGEVLYMSQDDLREDARNWLRGSAFFIGL